MTPCHALGDAPVTPDERDRLAMRYKLGPGGVGAAITTARRLGASDAPRLPDVVAGIRNNIAERMGGLAQRVEVKQAWDELGLGADTLDQVRALAAHRHVLDAGRAQQVLLGHRHALGRGTTFDRSTWYSSSSSCRAIRPATIVLPVPVPGGPENSAATPLPSPPSVTAPGTCSQWSAPKTRDARRHVAACSRSRSRSR